VKPTVVQRLATAVLAIGACALVAGCLSDGSPDFSWLSTSGRPDAGKADHDPQAFRVELRPVTCSAPVRGTQVLIATVYDDKGVPRRKRRVEWMLDGPGSIIEVGGAPGPGRLAKLDNKYAIAQTDSTEHRITRGNDNFTIGPGQAWCVVTSAVEGETTVTAYVPAISDWDKSRAYTRILWNDAGLQFPKPITGRAGGEYSLETQIARIERGSPAYRVRYRIVDGPPAALHSTRGGPVDSVTEAVTTVDQDGLARVSISQPAPAAGTNRIAIDVIKPNLDNPADFSVVFSGETRVTWQAAKVGVTVKAPRMLALNQDTTVTYALSEGGAVEAGEITMTARIPEGMSLIRTEPRAVVDGDEMIWTLSGGSRGNDQSVLAVFRPTQLGSATFTADARTRDGSSGRGTATATVAEAKLLVKLEGPRNGVVGESLPYQISVTNGGDGPADGIRVQARLDEGLESDGKLDQTIGSLSPGQSRTFTIRLTAKRGGKHTIQAGAAAEGGLVAVPQEATIEVQDAQLAVTAHGPSRAYVGQEVTWELVVRNNGDVPLGRVVVRATLPQEVNFVKATDGGKLNGRQVVWDLGTAPARQERPVSITVTCARPSAKASLTATASGNPMVDREGAGRTVALSRPLQTDRPVEAALEIIGVPALQVSVKDANDPVAVGQRTTYTIQVKNAGTLAAKNVQVTAEVPNLMKPFRATGPGTAGRISSEKERTIVVFPPIDSLAANSEATFVVEVEGLVPGDARFRAEVRSMMQAQPLRAEEPTRVLGRESRAAGP
jgi:uncharacterized repeat protein (TIGR01451 family)